MWIYATEGDEVNEEDSVDQDKNSGNQSQVHSSGEQLLSPQPPEQGLAIVAGEGPSSTEYERWLATRPEIEYAIDHACFRKGDGYEIWRNAWLILRDAYESQRHWQPIETAPKDGTSILIVADHRVRLGYYRPSDFRPQDEWLDSNGFNVYPTRWMPLPAAPEANPIERDAETQKVG